MKKVLVLFGGNSSEHYVSCKSTKSVVENIDKELFDYELVGISKDNKWFVFDDDLIYLEKGNWLEANVKEVNNIIEYLKKFDVVFPVIHGSDGEDGKLQGMLELFNINYVGCGVLSSAMGMDKEMSKIIFDSLKVPQVPYKVINENYNMDDLSDNISFPVIVKPASGGSSIGISKANNEEELDDAIKEAMKYDKKVIIEKFIKARELECAVLENNGELVISDMGEITAANEFYDYNAKYENKDSVTKIADDLPREVKIKIKEYASKIFNGFECKGLSRIDFFYDEDNYKIYINEINTMPGFTSISMYPTLIDNEGISYKDLITILINNAERKN